MLGPGAHLKGRVTGLSTANVQVPPDSVERRAFERKGSPGFGLRCNRSPRFCCPALGEAAGVRFCYPVRPDRVLLE
jgi:hypothetical protein